MGLDGIPAHAARSRAAAPVQDGMMTSGRNHIVAVLLLAAVWLGWAGNACAIDVEFAGRPVKREILALYDGRYESQPHLTRIHRFAEMPLNWLGFKVAYHDVRQPMPEMAEIQRYRGILTWFLEPMRNAEQVARWLDRATQTSLRYVVVGEIAPGADLTAIPTLQRIYARLGLEFTGGSDDLGFTARVVGKDDVMLGFERPLDRILTAFPFLVAKPNEATSHLKLSCSRHGKTITSDVITTSAKGAAAVYDFTIFYETTTDRSRWIVNPFLLFKRGFGDERFPIPDVTTLAGRRMYFSHIDGDGWNNLTEVEPYRARQLTAAEVIAEHAIAAYPDLPVSVGLIAGDALPLFAGTTASRRVARRLFAMPQVEVASHTHTHPFNWGFFERYDRSAELAMIDKINRPGRTVRQRIAADAVSTRRPAERVVQRRSLHLRLQRLAAHLSQVTLRARARGARRPARFGKLRAGRQAGKALSVERKHHTVRRRDQGDAVCRRAQHERR